MANVGTAVVAGSEALEYQRTKSALEYQRTKSFLEREAELQKVADVLQVSIARANAAGES